ncbi:MAG: 3-phosphoshikimate 1-carboxyvinyltransferase [Bacteroidales bacterium]|nr:3-phosphoshikimate 1-carboxyvinyltransferase [Bacteroidales bacterium]MBN2699701.1 3-phosphoshikimate 1-carboxyvinyltransferase [Bacteroidales bacterium]
MAYLISKPSVSPSGRIILPSSKSISNRLLIIDALTGSGGVLNNLAESDDTLLMKRALQTRNMEKNTGPAGTAMRFLTAFYAAGNQEVILTGSERMKKRPIGELVGALVKMGADISYLGEPGFPPLKIRGRTLKGGSLSVDGSISSQFISALLMIAPMIKNGLDLELQGELVSASYIRMTLELMRQWGAEYAWKDNRINIPEGRYQSRSYTVESDWSAASYWYAITALADKASFELPGLFKNSLQGDAVVSELFSKLAVKTEYLQEGVRISRNADGKTPEFIQFDFTLCPDLVQTLVPVLCASGIKFHFTGTRTLLIKETNRIFALQRELKKFGYNLKGGRDGSFLEWSGEVSRKDPDGIVETYHDHRMAMAFAPLCLKFGKIVIKDPEVVTKSYPAYWSELKRAGFGIDEI